MNTGPSSQEGHTPAVKENVVNHMKVNLSHSPAHFLTSIVGEYPSVRCEEEHKATRMVPTDEHEAQQMLHKAVFPQ